MRYLMSILFVATVMMAHGVGLASVPNQVLVKGQSITLTPDYEIGDVAVADPNVCDYLVGRERRSIYINARAGGETTVTLWNSEGDKRDEFSVRVVTTTLKELLDRARDALGDLKGVDLYVREGRVEIDGEVVEPDDFRRIESLAGAEPRMRSRVRLASDVIDKIVEAIDNAMDVPGVTVKALRDKIVLGGVAYSASDRRRAVEIAKLYYSDVMDLIDLKETGRRPGEGELIELTIHMMEIKKSALRQLGINWAPGSFANGGSSSAGALGGAGLLSSIGDMGKTLLGFVFQLVPKLRMIRERGDGRVLENPSIVVKSGETARIFSGSEVPYYKGDDVQFKKVGIEIQAEPIAVSDGIDLKIAATLSAPSADIRGAIDTNSVSTTAICSFGQSVVLGNVVRNGDVKMRNRVPKNVDTASALFTLFLSKDFQSNRSEFVIFVTPRLIRKPTAAEAMVRDFFMTEESMIRDRSKKEYEEYASGRSGMAPKREKGRTKRGRKRKWR